MDSDRGGPQPAAIEGGLGTCWFCGRAVSPRALFCHNCGSVQNPAPLDPFTRLGLARRFDIDKAELARQYAGFKRILEPERFANRGPRERAIAEKHRAILAEAHATVLDPLRRALWLLEADGIPVPTSLLAPPYAGEIEAAADAATLDGIARRISREQEAAVRGLSAAFRTGRMDTAAEQAATLSRLAAAAAHLGHRRTEIAPD